MDYFSLGYVHAPRSIWRGISKLPPAHFLVCEGGNIGVQSYWKPSLMELPSQPQEQIEMVRAMVMESVRARMVADVPLGALLSSGLDSAIVVAVMCQAAGRAGGVKTFCAGFEDKLYDERSAAKLVASHCGSEHKEILIQPQASPALVDEIVSRYDEPFADSGAIPTFLICKAAREHVTVALTGEGGDEVFGGYSRYRALDLAERMSPLGYLSVKVAAGAARFLAPHEERSRLRRLVRFADSLTQPHSQQYITYRSVFQQADLARLLTADFAAGVDLSGTAEWFCDLYESGEFADEFSRAQHHDMMTYLGNDVLVKSDRASMASSLELRAPMLAHELVPLGLSLPMSMKMQGGLGKQALRMAFADMLPTTATGAKKRGFGVPLGQWLKNELAGVLRETLFDDSFLSRGIVRREAMEGLINDHLSGVDDHRHRLWAMLVLARFLAKN